MAQLKKRSKKTRAEYNEAKSGKRRVEGTTLARVKSCRPVIMQQLTPVIEEIVRRCLCEAAVAQVARDATKDYNALLENGFETEMESLITPTTPFPDS